MNKTPQRKLDSAARQRAKVKADPEKLETQRTYMRQYAQQNRTKLNETNNALYQKKKIKIRLQRKNIQPTDQLIKFIEEHNGKCDICGAVGDGRWKEFVIDHCHTTIGFRGLLCTNCNRGLGHFKDQVELLEKAIKYLRQYRKMIPNEFLAG